MFVSKNFILAASIFLQCVLILSFSKTLPAQDYAAIERVSIPNELYSLEIAKFLYLTGNYSDALLFSREILKKNRNPTELEKTLLLKELSGLRLKYRDNAPHGLRSDNSASGIFFLFDTLYRQGDYKSILFLSREAKDAVSLYFRGLALYTLDKFDEAILPLNNIPEKETLFPNARMLLSQIMVAKGDYGAAKRYLEETVKIAEGGMLNKAHLLMGYLYFEKGEFLNAQKSFLKVDTKSGFYRNAMFGAALSDIKMGRYDEALSLTVDADEYGRSYDSKGFEMRLAAAYLHFRLGRLKEARESFLKVMKDLRDAEEGLKLLEEGKSLNKEYSMSIVNMGAEKMRTENDELEYIGLFKDAPDIAEAVAYYSAFVAMNSSYAKKEADINSLIISLENGIKAKEEAMAYAANRVEKIKKLVTALANKIERAEIKKSLKDANLISSEHAIIQRWEKLLNRALTKQEKYVVRLIAMSGEEGLWCLNNTTYCPILYMMTIDPAKNRAEDSEHGILERIVKDTQGAMDGKPIRYEQEASLLKEEVTKKIDDEKERIQELERLKAMIAKNKKNAEQGADRSLKLLEESIGRRAAMIRYEIRTFEEKAAAGIEYVDRAMEAAKR